MYNGNDRINMAFHGSETIAESFDACPILYIGYDMHETSILWKITQGLTCLDQK
jgi:hypothetical protein